MSNVADLVASRPPPPGFDVFRAAYVKLLVAIWACPSTFFADLLGLVVSERTDNAIYFRGWEGRLHYSLVLRESTASQLPSRLPCFSPVTSSPPQAGQTRSNVDGSPLRFECVLRLSS